jgi:hypothetical protein
MLGPKRFGYDGYAADECCIGIILAGGLMVMEKGEDFKNLYAIEEYKSLRQEILVRMNTQKQLELFSLTAAGVIWGAGYFKTQASAPLWMGTFAGLLILATGILAAYEATAIFKLGSFVAAKYEISGLFGLSWESITYTTRDTFKPRVIRHTIYYCVVMLVNVLMTLLATHTEQAWRYPHWVVTLVIGAGIYFPVKRIQVAYNTKDEQITRWLGQLDGYPISVKNRFSKQ